MAPHIISWGASAPAMSPASSSSPSVVSFDSIPSDIQAPKVPATKTGTESVNSESSTGELSASLTSASTYPGIDDSFQRHDTYFFKDGNITFLVDGTLYCVHRFFFSRDSVYFSTRLAQLDTRDHEAFRTLISLGDVKREDFEALLSIIYPKDFEEHILSYQQWKSVLHLSTRWGFASIRKLALKLINPPTPHDRLMLARTYAVYQWVVPALTALCERADSLSLTEARQMRIEDVVIVAAVREDVRGRALRLDAKVTQLVEAALTGKLPHNEGDSAPRACIEGGAAKQGTSSVAAESPVDAGREDGAQNSGSSLFAQWPDWPGKNVAKSPEEKATQGVGNATRLEQVAPEPRSWKWGERAPSPSDSEKLFDGRVEVAAQAVVDSASPASKITTSKQKPSAGKQASKGLSLSASAEKSVFTFGTGGIAPPSPSVGTPLRPVESSSSAELAAKKSKTPDVNPAGSKVPVNRK